MNLLDSGAQIPTFSLDVGEHESITLPDDIQTDYAIVLFYRGHW